jgi:hypothetical protein
MVFQPRRFFSLPDGVVVLEVGAGDGGVPGERHFFRDVPDKLVAVGHAFGLAPLAGFEALELEVQLPGLGKVGFPAYGNPVARHGSPSSSSFVRPYNEKAGITSASGTHAAAPERT